MACAWACIKEGETSAKAGKRPVQPSWNDLTSSFLALYIEDIAGLADDARKCMH